MKQLSRDEMKKVMGGFAPCDSCTSICYSNSGGYGNGNCNTLPAAEQAGCHNYCCTAGQSTYWC